MRTHVWCFIVTVCGKFRSWYTYDTRSDARKYKKRLEAGGFRTGPIRKYALAKGAR